MRSFDPDPVAFIYGSSWKSDRTKSLVIEALTEGFKAVDTAAQPKHNREDLVGAAVRELIKTKGLKRQDIYVREYRQLEPLVALNSNLTSSSDTN